MLLNILLFLVLAERISGIVAVDISACSGESVKLFSNMSFTLNASDVYLYVNDSKYDLIALWSQEEKNKVLEKVSLDDNGNVWIHNITLSDEKKYKVVHDISGSSHCLWDAQLTVLVAPLKSCRPQVTRDGNKLIASLQVGTDCGKPEAVPYLLKYPDITYSSRTMATLTPGREAGTYYACIETPALRCARSYNISDFCSSFTVYESCHQNVLLILASAFPGLFGLLVTVLFLYLRRKRKVSLGSKEESHPMNQ